MSIIGLNVRFTIATRNFTRGQLETVKNGRHSNTPEMVIAREIYLELEAARFEEYLSRTGGDITHGQCMFAA